MRSISASVPSLSFPAADSRFPSGLRGLLGGAVASGALSRHSAFRDPEFREIAKSLASITPVDIAVTLARVIAALIVSFVLGVALAMAMYRSRGARELSAPDDPHPDGGAGRLLDSVRGAVVSRRRIPHRLRAGGGVRAGVSGRFARRHARRAARTAPHDALVPADHLAVLRQADAAGDRADPVHQLEGQYQPGHPRRHHRRAGRRGHRHRPSVVGGAGIVLGRRRVRLDAGAGGAAVLAGGAGRARRGAHVAVAAHESRAPAARRRSKCAACARCSARRPPGSPSSPSTGSTSPSRREKWSPSSARPAAASRRFST